MSKKRMTRRVFAVVFALLFMITGVTIPTLTPQAATEMDLSSYITMSGKTEAAKGRKSKACSNGYQKRKRIAQTTYFQA